MSLRLKNESTTFPPGGLQFEERQLGWKNTINDPGTVWSWDGLETAILNLRRANAARFPKLSQDRATIRRQISEQNARRIAAMPGTESYLRSESVVAGGTAPNPTSGQGSTLSQAVGLAVNRVDALARGAASLLDWWTKDLGKPVEHDLAEKRAAICVECPKNNQEGVDSWFTKPAAAFIRKKMEARTDLKLETSNDEKIGVCEACQCVLRLAVHQPLDIKLKHMSEEQKNNCWSACWIVNQDA
jgi:hypothetical protein